MQEMTSPQIEQIRQECRALVAKRAMVSGALASKQAAKYVPI